MNKKVLSIFAALLAMTAVTFTSCKDDDDDNPTPAGTTNQQKIIGTWHLSTRGGDVNNNGTLDAGETASVTGVYDLYGNFKTNGEVISYGSAFGSPIDTGYSAWQIIGDNYLRIVDTDGDTTSFLIYQLDASNLITKDTSTNPDIWEAYTK